MKGLESGILKGVGLDVVEGECGLREEKQLLSDKFSEKCDFKTVLEDHVLASDPRVIITPHNAFNSEEALRRIIETTFKNIKLYFKGGGQNFVRKK